MPASRHFLFLLLMSAALQLAATAQAADAPDHGIEAVRTLAAADAPQLALQRIEALQPPEMVAMPPQGISPAPPKGTASAAPWVEWEGLRLRLLARLQRDDEILRRAAAWTAAVPANARALLHADVAAAALRLGRTTVAREHAGRALWDSGSGPAAVRELRLLVIRSHARDGRADDAYRSMLRFEQDYRPLDKGTAAAFVDLLLDLGRTRESVNWLGLLEERGATRLRLRLHSGVITPQDAADQARSALGRSDGPAWWRVLKEAAERQNDDVLRITALEQLLEAGPERIAGPDAEAAGLWEVYINHARAAANSRQLLSGDDASWLEFAKRRRAAEPAEARAYFAYLARHARERWLQQEALAGLASEYAHAKLPRAGLRMFGILPDESGALTVPARRVLGAMAETAGDQARAFGYWQGLPAPENMSALTWQLRLCALALRAGRDEAAAGMLGALAAQRSDIPLTQVPEWIDLADQAGDHGLQQAARTLFERVLAHADPAQSRRVLYAIARTHEAPGQPLLAAEFYLRSALLAPKEAPPGGAPQGNGAAAQARLQAGLSLLRGGLRDDARLQFEWLLKNARDPEQIAVARRELGF